MSTFCFPSCSTSCPGPWPRTSAEGEYTRRNSQGSWKVLPSANEISSTRDFWCSLISVGCGVLASMPAIRFVRRCGLLLHRRCIAGGGIGAAAEKVIIHLLHEVVARLPVGKAEPVFVHQHLLVLEPLFPCFLRHALVDAPAEFSGIGRQIERFGL